MPTSSPNYWQTIAANWKNIGKPLRPGAADVENFNTLLNLPEQPALRVLILGVTQELYNLDWPDNSEIFAVDRSKDMIKSGGEWISSVDLENHIQSHSSITMAAVVAQPHPKWDERPVAVVVCTPGCSLTKAEVIEWCKSKFARFQLPDDVLFWSEIPMGSTGKMSKSAIRDKLKQSGYVLAKL